ncbi:SPOR domain-containing protein [Jannaschia sp. M317]|uniref:SPOR domain-containing protein n=1 Tax=Jannaschia sp. M317 TaxID=2867011 RepID=UPI0021A44439|nr:SPOR domain-containing protein [Jannaschia sp. M317]UWQ17138.1 SPOR domain-containing protein [Jannaschia sp. M317]
MADLDYYGADYGVEAPNRLAEAMRGFGLVNWAGAITSLGLAGGMAVWAVDLTFRDMSNVPVIAAIEGDMRVAPEDPGGLQAPFQGMAISDITSGGPAAPAPEEIVLAPSPVDLEAPSLADRRQALGLAPVDPVRQAVVATAPPEPAIAAPEPVDLSSVAAALAEAHEPLDEIVGASTPVVNAPVITPEATPSEPQIAAAPARPTGPGVARSVRPSQRPAGLRAAAAPARVIAPTDAPEQAPTQQVARAGGTLDVDPASVAPGTRVVQLGAYDSEAAARSEWERLNGRFRDYMDGKQRLVQKARSGGRDFWRLRVVGFDDGSDARRFCSALLAKDAACIPVTVR